MPVSFGGGLAADANVGDWNNRQEGEPFPTTFICPGVTCGIRRNGTIVIEDETNVITCAFCGTVTTYPLVRPELGHDLIMAAIAGR